MTNAVHTLPSGHTLWREGRELALIVIAGLIVATLFRIILFQPFTIPSSSMEPGLVIGDYVVVSKFPYGWSRSSLPGGHPQAPGRLLGGEPRRGDVVVFRLPRAPGEVWIKRIVGLPGDGTMSIEDLGFWGPDFIMFLGKNSDGKPVRLIQHYGQINVLLDARKKPEEREARRIGFQLSELVRKTSPK